MAGRFACAIGCLLAMVAVSGAQETAAPVVPAQQAATSPEPIHSPEMDALAAKLLLKLNEDKVTSVVIVGGGGSGGKVSELDVNLRDCLNEALVRQATGVHVATRDETAAELKRLRISIGMLYSDTLAGWIATNAHADGFVTIEMERVGNGHAAITAEVFDKRTRIVYDKKTKAEVSSAKFEAQIDLTETQAKSATRDYHPPLNTLAGMAGKDGASMPTCIYCPKPEYTEEGRKRSINGTVYFMLTVLPDGTTDDILITRPVGYGLDGAAVDALIGWRFRSGLDAQKRPVALQVRVEVNFALYAGPF